MGILQVMALLGCYLVVCGFLKVWEKGLDSEELESLRGTRWYERMNFVRVFIWLLLLVPVAMAFICTKLTRAHRDIAYLGPDGFWLAVTVTLIVFIYAGMTVKSACQGPPRWISFR